MALNLDQVRTLAERVAASHGLEVVDVEFLGGGGKHRTLRVFIEKNAVERAKLLEKIEHAKAEVAKSRAAGRNSADAEPLPAVDGVEHEGFDDGVDLEDVDDDDLELDAEDDANELEDDEDDFGGEDADGALGDEAITGEGDVASEEELLSLLPSVANLEYLSGITHEDCEQFSRDFGTVLDVEELVPGTEYLLEVSSPGLDRKLSREDDYRRFQGSLVKLQTFEAVGGNRHWSGRLASFGDGKISVDLTQAKQARQKGKKATAVPQTVEIALANIEKAQLLPDF